MSSRKVSLGHFVTLTTDDGQLPTRVLLFKAGANETSKGTFTYDPADAATLMQHVNGWAQLGFDVDHLSTVNDSLPEAHGYFGWFTLMADSTGIYADNIEWTARGAALLKDKAFKFTSPYFLADDTGKILQILNCALTNMPATVDQTPFILNQKDSDSMDEDIKTPDIDSEASVEETKLSAPAEDDKPEACTDDDAAAEDSESAVPPMTDEEKDAALSALQSQVSDLLAANESLTAELASLKSAAEDDKPSEQDQVASIAASLSADGYLPPAQLPWAQSLSLAQVSAFAKLQRMGKPIARQVTIPTKAPGSSVDVRLSRSTQADVPGVQMTAEDIRNHPAYKKARGLR